MHREYRCRFWLKTCPVGDRSAYQHWRIGPLRFTFPPTQPSWSCFGYKGARLSFACMSRGDLQHRSFRSRTLGSSLPGRDAYVLKHLCFVVTVWLTLRSSVRAL